MIQTVEAIIDSNGAVKLLGNVVLPRGKRVLVTVLDDIQADIAETALLSERSLAEDWMKDEEDEAWSHLQSDQ